MKTLLKSATLLACATSLSTCAMLNAARSGNVAGAAQAAADAGVKVKHAVERAETECAPLEKKIVGWPEERAIGGAMAIGYGKKAQKSFYIDITDKDPKKLKATADAAEKAKKPSSIALSPSEKNDLNNYIQVVGQSIAAGSTRPGIAWTFGVLEDDTPNAFSSPGGYVFLTTGLLSLMENEAQLAGVIGHEIGHITGKHAIKSYQKGKSGACVVAIAGLNLVNEGASDVPGGDEFVKNSKFGKTMKKFASPDGADMDNDPDVDVDFMVWFTNRIIDFNNLKGNAKEDEFDADRIAQELMSSAGYDSKELEKFITKIPSRGGLASLHPSNDDRIAALGKLRPDATAFGGEGGKAPAFLASVKWPSKK